MANLTKNVGTVTLTGTAEKVTLPASYGWVWVKNMSEGDIFAGLSEDISEGADGVMTIPAGECGRIQADGFSSVYLMGSGKALVAAQNYAECPFKTGAKGGGSGGSGGGLTLLGTYSLETNTVLGTLDDLPRGTRLLFEYAPTSGTTSINMSNTYRMIPGYVPPNDNDVVICHCVISPNSSSGSINYINISTSKNKVYANTNYSIKNWNVYKWEV